MRNLRKKNNLNKLRCSGMNLVRFINVCTSNGIKLEQLLRIDSKTIEFEVNDYALKQINSIALDEYTIELVKVGGLRKIFKTIYFRMGIFIGFVLSIIMFIITNNRIFNIEIWGLSSIEKIAVEQALEEYGIKEYSLMNFNKSNLEEYLSKSFDFSLVSVITKGNSLIINVKEELPNITNSYNSILAPYNMIITKINVYSGTSRVNIGDIVFKGDILVEAYEISNNERILVEPCAEINGDTFISEKYEFFSYEEVMVRTGKSKILDSEILMGNIRIYSSSSNNEFEYFESENQNIVLSNYFLPLMINKNIVYEIRKEKIERDFESEKEEIILKLKEKVYSKLATNMQVDSEEIQISSINTGNIVTIYLKSSVYLKYNIN